MDCKIILEQQQIKESEYDDRKLKCFQYLIEVEKLLQQLLYSTLEVNIQNEENKNSYSTTTTNNNSSNSSSKRTFSTISNISCNSNDYHFIPFEEFNYSDSQLDFATTSKDMVQYEVFKKYRCDLSFGSSSNDSKNITESGTIIPVVNGTFKIYK